MAAVNPGSEELPDPSVHARGVAFAALAACTFGVGPVMIKVALDSMSAWSLLVARLAVAAVLMWPLLVARRSRPRSRAEATGWLAALALGATAYTAQLACFSLALERVSASLTTILFHMGPMVVVTVAVLTGRERLTPLRGLALVLGVGGVAVVAGAGGQLRAEPVGVALAVGSALSYATVVLCSDLLGEHVEPLPQAVLQISGAALAFAVSAPFIGISAPPGTGSWLLVLVIAVVPGVIGTTAMLAGVGRIGPSLVSILLTLEPVLTVAVAWVALGERLNPLQVAGGAVVLAAAIVARRAATEAPLGIG